VITAVIPDRENLMRTTISVRHSEITPLLRTRARAITDRLGALSPHALEATVVFDEGPNGPAVEIRLHARGRKVLVGAGEASDHRTALDRAEEKIRPQVIKASRTRLRARRVPTRDA
jgi:ribosome-associated translation inhibitor RaiA